jgi:hypothetical protein
MVIIQITILLIIKKKVKVKRFQNNQVILYIEVYSLLNYNHSFMILH